MMAGMDWNTADWGTTLLRLRADENGWNDVAKATGLSRMQVSRIARGDTPNPRIDTAQRIAAYYARCRTAKES